MYESTLCYSSVTLSQKKVDFLLSLRVSWIMFEYRFSRPFSSSLHSILEKCVFNFVPDTQSGMCECSLQFRLWSINIILKHCHSISCFVTRFRQLLFKVVGHSIAEHETAKAFSSIGIHFRQSFNQNRLPDVKAQ